MIYRGVFKKINKKPSSSGLVSKAQITNKPSMFVVSKRNELVALHFTTINLPMLPVNEVLTIQGPILQEPVAVPSSQPPSYFVPPGTLASSHYQHKKLTISFQSTSTSLDGGISRKSLMPPLWAFPYTSGPFPSHVISLHSILSISTPTD